MQNIKNLGWMSLNTIQLLFTLLYSIFWTPIALIVRVVTGSAHVPLRMASHIWSRILFYGAFARCEVEGQDNVDFSRPHVFIANHSSMIDVCALFMAVPVPLRFVLKAELGKVPFLGWYTRAMDMVLIERGGARKTVNQLQRATALVRNGHSLAAFPEGTRSPEGTLRRFKSGVFKVAIAAGVPVVPVTLEGTGQVMPPGGFRIRPGLIRVRIGKPIETAGLDRSHAQSLARQAREAIARNMSSEQKQLQ